MPAQEYLFLWKASLRINSHFEELLHEHGGVKRMQPMHRSATLRCLCALLLIAAPMAVQALGLGRLVVNSGLDEPLNGQIELISPTSQEIKTLKTTLASREDFDIAGVERNALLFDITYSVIQHSNGQYFIKLATHKPVREPFVHFLINVEWNGGRLIREYSALLDPPQWVAGRPADINVPDSAASEPAQETPLPIAEIPAAQAAPMVAEETLPPIGSPDPSEAAATEKSELGASQPTPSSPDAATPDVAAAPISPAEPAAQIEAIAPPADLAATEPTASQSTEQAPAAVAEAPAPYERTPRLVTEPAPATASQYGPVKKGETLYQISKNLNVDKSLTPQQIMLALLRANPAAFFGKNINNLKVGKILDVPEQETIAAVPKAQAAKEFSAQYDAWQEYKLKLAGASRAVAVAEPSEPQVKPEPKQSDAKKPEKVAKVEKAAVAKAEKTAKDKSESSGKAVPTDLLKIVRANLEQELAEDSTKTPGVETKKDAVKEQRALKERVATLEEAIESKQMQNKEMRERVGKLQEQVKNTERLVDLENKDLASAQKLAAEKQVAEAKAAVEKAAQEKAIQEKAAQEKAAQEKTAQELVAAEAAAKAAQTTKPADTAKPEAVPAKKPAAAPKPVPAPAPEENFLDGIVASISDNPLTLTLLAALGVLAIGVGGMYAYRRRRASREFSESILSSNSLSGEASQTDNSGQAAASDTSFLSDFSQGGMGNIHTDEVDPIAEAEVYLAYGRDEQAEEILKDAIVKDPLRQELKGKLLEIYFQRNDVAAFETLAEELYAALEGKGSKVWEKAEEMGRKLSPTNPMFRGGQPAVRTAAAATTMMAAETENTSMLSTQSLEFEQPAAPARSSGLDFNLDFDSQPVKAPEPASLDMTFDMDMAEETPAVHRTSGLDMDFSLAAPEPDTSSNLIDFNLPSATESSSSLDFSTAESNTVVENEIDFSSDSGVADDATEGSLPGWDETATKLDLAKAYIDMGDSEGARSILDEVMSEGNDNQKRQAQDLAAQIAA